uniref:Beta-1,4-N-acetylgalactosaminyltransferase n=1 Tax=Paramormyrops kingsleyae TaxID=1676925 RepID=A0A3B3SWH2_9TELE|nr:N-acetyl-beta-glucosaminyl-glycoprotein 4-beta-N-acetylgalactosaminyltransferase 1-like [Paramormyrops kingsleyae]
MLRFPVKKIRKQFRLLLLLVLLTFAVWFTYLHINQGKAIKVHLNYGKDAEKQAGGTDTSRQKSSHSAAGHHKSDDASDSREVEPAEDEPNMFGEEGRDAAEIRKFLSQKENKLPWKPEYKGQANLHVFEDWCGSSVAQLRKNLHFPLYPHLRTTVKKLAVAPRWKNYGLRIFGFIHPYKDGDFQFAVSSDDNSEFWLSPDESPHNARLLAYVGRLGSEWTAPGEFSKFRSQSSKSVHLMYSRRYYFEVLHKQDDKGSDHVEVGWRPFLPGLKYEVIDSAYISLYTDESSLKMNSVAHIPQTLASHSRMPRASRATGRHGADMLKPDPRDTFFSTPMIEVARLKDVLPTCAYSPSYVLKDFPIARYQGLQFVYLSFVYPNDFTRLTHMEKENKCFYRESPIYLEKFGFYKYMKMDEEEDDRPYFFANTDEFLEEEQGAASEDEPTVGDTKPLRVGEQGGPINPKASVGTAFPSAASRLGRARPVPDQWGRHSSEHELDGKRSGSIAPAEPQGPVSREQPEHGQEPAFSTAVAVRGRTLSWSRTGSGELSRRGGTEALSKLNKSARFFYHRSPLPALAGKAKETLLSANAGRSMSASPRANGTRFATKSKEDHIYVTRPRPSNSRRGLIHQHAREIFPGLFLYQNGKTTKLVNLRTRPKRERGAARGPKLWPRSSQRNSKTSLLGGNFSHTVTHKISNKVTSTRHHQRRIENRQAEREEAPASTINTRNITSILLDGETSTITPTSPKTLSLNSSVDTLPTVDSIIVSTKTSEIESQEQLGPEPGEGPEEGGLSEYSYEEAEARPNWPEEAINWQRTFSVNTMDFEVLRSDWNDLRCNVSGNLQLGEGEVVDVLAQYIEKLNEQNGRIYTLLRIINVEKRRDSARGNRYLVELELMERGKKVVRLSEYIYLLQHPGHPEDGQDNSEGTGTSAHGLSNATGQEGPLPSVQGAPSHVTPLASTAYVKPLLCQPDTLKWRHDVMVHFVVPVKNQARWVQQFISDMEFLYHETKDDNFSIIIVDFQSDDMDVEQALKDSTVPRYEYLRREGNFERSAGLQVGVDSVKDSHSIVFLCDLHIHFPLNILESIRKHCIEGLLAFAPIVMRLACGSSPQEPDGYWEVNGFGLFGIYKSDFDKIGGMNTEEFKDRWGGEDWELLDRVLQNGLEVERLRLRNFFHYYHSKRGMWNTETQKKSPKG